MALFDRLERSLSRTVDRQFAVRATIDGMTKTPNGHPQLDPARAEIHVRGIFDVEDTFAAIESGAREGKGNDFRTLATGTNYLFSVDVSRYPAAKDVRQSDRLILDDTRRFNVMSVRCDGVSRVVLSLISFRTI